VEVCSLRVLLVYVHVMLQYYVCIEEVFLSVVVTVAVLFCHWLQVLEVHTDSINVHFIDYGNKDTVQVKVTQRADSEFFSIAPLAEKFVIAGLSPAIGVSWTHAEYDLLEKNLLNTEFVGEVISDGVTGFPPLVHLMNVDFVLPAVLPSLTSRWPSLPTAQQFALDKSYTVFVTHYESILNFWVQDLCKQDPLDRFHADLASSVEAGKSHCLESKQCWPGTLCVARYKGSDQFFRAVIREVDCQGSYVVTFVDYGDSAVVNVNDLWPIEERFLSLPVQVLRCCATGQSAHLGCDKLRSAFLSGCPINIRIGAVSSIHYLVEIDFTNRSAFGQPVVQLPSPVGSAGLPATSLSTLSVPRYGETSLAEGVWHRVCISSVEPDGSFYCQLLADTNSLNTLMLELSSVRPLPVNGAVVDGMACVVRNPADGFIYRARVCTCTSLVNIL